MFSSLVATAEFSLLSKIKCKKSHKSSEYISISVTAVFFLFFHKNTEKIVKNNFSAKETF